MKNRIFRLRSKNKTIHSSFFIFHSSLKRTFVLLFLGSTMVSCKVHEYVDLGLLSGTLWATCNVGANTPEDFGDFFAWGETKPKPSYDPENYTFHTARRTLSIRNDVAHRRWHGKWRIPTISQWEELRDSCIWQWYPPSVVEDLPTATPESGIVKGYRVTGPNGNSIFLPAAGDIDGTIHYGIDTYGDYWSSSIHDADERKAEGFIFYTDGARTPYCWPRPSGHSIRPVRKR